MPMQMKSGPFMAGFNCESSTEASSRGLGHGGILLAARSNSPENPARSKLLQQAVDVVEFFLGTAALFGAAAQFLEDVAGALQGGFVGHLHLIAVAGPPPAVLAAQRVFILPLAFAGALLPHHFLRQLARALAHGIERIAFGGLRIVERALAQLALRLAHLLAGLAQILAAAARFRPETLQQPVELLAQIALALRQSLRAAGLRIGIAFAFAEGLVEQLPL